MRSAQMIIQQKFLCLAAYEDFVLEISALDILYTYTILSNLELWLQDFVKISHRRKLHIYI